jgi:tripartite ATP-independent transporter DctP family solute receptor
MIGRRAFGLAAAAAAAAVLCGAPAFAQKTMTVSTVLGADSPQAKVWERFQQALDERLGAGAIRINVLTGGVMGGEREEAEAIRLGSLQGSVSTLANLGAWVPDGQVFDMPFMFRDQAHIDAVMEGPVGADMKAKYLAHGFRVLGFINFGGRQLLAKEEIRTPAQMQGKRMRVIQSPLHIELWRSLGANPTPVPITEAYNALQTGVVDAMDFTESGYAQAKLYEVVPYLMQTEHIWALGVMYFSDAFWNTLSDREKQAMQAAADASTKYFNELVRADHERGLAEARARGATIVRPDPGPWREAMGPFWEAFAPRVGGIERVRAIANTR